MSHLLHALVLALLLLTPKDALAKKGKAADPLSDLGSDPLGEESDGPEEVPEQEDAESTGDDSEDETAASDDESDQAETGDTAPEDAAQGTEEKALEEGSERPASTIVRVALGGGLGMRGLRTPTTKGSQLLKDELFPAIDVGLSAHFDADGTLSLRTQLRYQSSVLLRVSPPQTAERISAQSDRAELTAAPVLRLGDSPRSVRIALPLGGALRAFWHARDELPVARFAMFGVLARPELLLPVGESLTLRAGVEAQWFFAVAETLGSGNPAGHALSLGGELAAELRLSDTFSVDVTYRETFAMGLSGGTFEDAERFATARLIGTL